MSAATVNDVFPREDPDEFFCITDNKRAAFPQEQFLSPSRIPGVSA